VLGVNRVLIEGNGAKWAGDEPDSLGDLLNRLGQNTLSPMFAQYGFASLAHFSREVHEWTDDGNYITQYEDLGPIYSDAPFAVSFFGNFWDVSAGFQITTDDPEVVEVLLAAIAANMSTPAYRHAAKEWEAWNRNRRAAR